MANKPSQNLREDYSQTLQDKSPIRTLNNLLLVILDKDILSIDKEEIETIKVLETIKEGNTIFKA